MRALNSVKLGLLALPALLLSACVVEPTDYGTPQPQPQYAPQPVVEQPPPQQYDQYAQPVDEGDQVQVQEAPPPLPEYDQPPCPGDGYLWTPGYWRWGGAGYYWVPGVWVLPPSPGVLWTPPFWG